MEVKNMPEKQQPIVALNHPARPKKSKLRPQRNTLVLTLKKNDLEQVYIVCGKTDYRPAQWHCRTGRI